MRLKCIGGPYDGRMINVARGVREVLVALPEAWVVLAADDNVFPDSPQFREGVYRVADYIDCPHGALRWEGET